MKRSHSWHPLRVHRQRGFIRIYTDSIRAVRNSAAKRLERSVVPATPSQRATEETILEKMAMSQVTTAPGTVVDEGLEQLEEVLGDLQANRLPAMDMIVAKLRKTSLADDASLREVRLGLQLLKQGATQIDNALILLQSRK